MVQLTCIYTRSGDKGTTSLGDGSRVSKCHIRLQTIGTVDELNSILGIVHLHIDDPAYQIFIRRLQQDLFDVGADLCWPQDPPQGQALRIQATQVQRLEAEIDQMNQHLAPLKSFVLPGGSPASAYLHLARAVARRAERDLWALHEQKPLNPELMRFINRLSDYLFVMARFMNTQSVGDVLWIPGQNTQ